MRSSTIAGAEEFAESLRRKVGAVAIPVRDMSQKNVTCSIGLASTTSNAEVDMSHLIARADRALYRAKQAGRNQVVVSERIELRVDRLVS